jgi:phosphopantothenoylcysteine decarboxylase/phosphopantothenate--cysteine ligase
MTSTGDDTATVLTGSRVVLGVSGGIAAYKAALVARLLVTAGATVDTVLTRGAARFIGAPTFEGITGRPCRTEVWDDVDGDTHVALARRADAILVYPATAHLLAKAAQGLADDLLTTSLLAATCPVVLCPAMHTEMWQHAATRANAGTLTDRGVHLVGPAAGALMGGDVGAGRAVDPDVAVAAVGDVLGRRGQLRGRTVVVTAGGTREAIDPVRFLGNRSTGKMGFAIAREAARRGAAVHLVTGRTHLDTPPGVRRHDITSALEMRKAVVDLASSADVVIKAAAVADFRPAGVSEQKLKKGDGVPVLELERNPDILAELGETKAGAGSRSPLLVGFAAETQDVERHGREKLERKNTDLLVVNDVSTDDAGFEVDTNRVVILARDGGRIDVSLTTKAAIAARLLDEVVARLG